MNHENAETIPVSSLGPDVQELVRDFAADHNVLNRARRVTGMPEVPDAFAMSGKSAVIEFSDGPSGHKVKFIADRIPPFELDMSR